MRNILLGAASALALAPGVASAALTLNLPSVNITEVPTTTQTLQVEAFFTETPPVVDERLAGFAVRVEVIGGTANGVHIQTAKPSRLQLTPTDHPYVLNGGTTNADTGEPAPARPEIPANDDAYTVNSITLAGLTDSGKEQNIDDNEGVVRFAVIIEAGTVGAFPMNFDTLVTSFADADGAPIPVALANGLITITPEPASLGLLALGGLLGLRRRRNA